MMSPSPERSGEHQRADPSVRAKSSLPRLPPEYYRGHAAVFWTPGIANRATGWLTPAFHTRWQFMLLHACARYALACPAYVLMPDHIHLVWIGLDDQRSDQRLAVEFIRKHLRPHLAPAEWQKQPHDHVLREKERERDALRATVYYVFENSVRAGLVGKFQDYAYLGCCVPGYPELDIRSAEYWERFWRVHNYLVESAS